MSTPKEYQLYLENLGNKLAAFNIKHGDIVERQSRNNLIFPAWLGLEYANTELYAEANRFVENVHNQCRKLNKDIPQVLSILILNEVKRRRNKTAMGLKFPRFLEEKRHLDKLCQYCLYLLGENDSIVNKIDPIIIKRSNELAKESVIKYLNKIYDETY